MEPLDLVLSVCRLAPAGRLADIGIRGGRIAAIGGLAEVSARRRLPAEGRLLKPGFVDAHVHLDKAYLLDLAPSREGTLAEAIRVTAGAKRTVETHAPRPFPAQCRYLALPPWPWAPSGGGGGGALDSGTNTT